MSPAIAPPSRALYYASLSRIFLLSLIATCRLLFRPYDTSASLNPPCLSFSSNQSQPSDQIIWPRVASAIESSVVWDGVYFVRIAECGYEYEQTYAFLPLLPVAISLFSRSVFAPLVPLIGYRAVLALSGYMLSNTAFLLATLYLYRLSNLILKDSAAALRASVLFCLNPASIFYSSMYKSHIFFNPFEYNFTCSPYAYRRGIFRISGLYPRKLGNVLDPCPINNCPSYPTLNAKIKKGAV